MFEIRFAGIKDIPLIRDLTFQVWPQTYSSILTKDQIEYMLEMMYSESSLEKQMTDEACTFLVISDNNFPVGFASISEVEPQNWKLHKIYILPSQQGKGTGKNLLDFILDYIKSNNGNLLYLQVNRNNKAKEFYERLGFEVIRTADVDIGNGYFMNDYIMEKKIT